MEMIKMLNQMTESEKDAHVEGVELGIDYGLFIEKEDLELYKAIIEERKNR